MSEKIMNCPHCGKILPKEFWHNKNQANKIEVKCTRCGSTRNRKDAKRYTLSEVVQRYYCVDCGRRFSKLWSASAFCLFFFSYFYYWSPPLWSTLVRVTSLVWFMVHNQSYGVSVLALVASGWCTTLLDCWCILSVRKKLATTQRYAR